MTASLSFTTESLGNRVKSRLERLPQVNIFDWQDAHRIVCGDITVGSADEVVDALVSSGLRIEAFNFDLLGSDGKWDRPDPTLIAAELLGDQFVFLDKGNTFDPPLPEPCLGMVAPTHPIHIAKKPIGHACCAKWDIIFSEPICRFLRDHSSGTLGPVMSKGHVVENWHRFFVNERLSVLAGPGVKVGNCAACHVSGRWNAGVWLGRAPKGLAFCQEELGISHGNLEHPYILSVKVAAELARRFHSGFGLQPIVNVDSLIGQKMVQLLERINGMPILTQS